MPTHRKKVGEIKKENTILILSSTLNDNMKYLMERSVELFLLHLKKNKSMIHPVHFYILLLLITHLFCSSHFHLRQLQHYSPSEWIIVFNWLKHCFEFFFRVLVFRWMMFYPDRSHHRASNTEVTKHSYLIKGTFSICMRRSGTSCTDHKS